MSHNHWQIGVATYRRMAARIGRSIGFGFAALWFGIETIAAGGELQDRSNTTGIQFARDIRPIFSEKCFACHGPDETSREANLRFDIEEAAKADLGGYHAILPGSPDESELLARIGSDDSDLKMPPPDSDKHLSLHEIDLIRRWIAEGAKWQGHWSFEPLHRPEIPVLQPELTTSKESGWPSNAIDAFVLRRLREAGLSPSPEADRRTLARRLSFDLTGLPLSPEEVEAFQMVSDSAAYEQLVGRLLASPHYGERMAMYWQDLVRYADTNGIHGDNDRPHSPYRDYVIGAFNNNLPFDRFTIEQLAGDLIPDATAEQKIASGYNRLNMTTREGGAQPKEYQAKYAADRVRNVSSVWLGVTMGCAECHDHKFDPITTRDFYSMAAFFADLQEVPVGVQPPVNLPLGEAAAAISRLNVKLTAAKINMVEPAQDQIAELQNQIDQINRQAAVLISISVEPKTTRILPKGNWLDETGVVVLPDVPQSLPDLPARNERATRMDLAKWLMRRDHPLVARTFVNRLWMLFFGRGLATSVNDFGAQGTWPSHPALLDWLAVEFIESGWDVKRMVRLIVMSNTYRQSSSVTANLREHDPLNRWLARQSSFRLDAEMIRDNAVAVAGLLSDRVGGLSVRPYQPAGYWQHLNFPKRVYASDGGEGQYRRGLYTHWQRTFLHPSLVAFDAPSREVCTAQRSRSNTPLQSLVLLNDPTYVEAARVLAERMIRKGSGDAIETIQATFRAVLARPARPKEVEVLTELFEMQREEYAANIPAAKALTETGQSPVPQDIEPADLAAWTAVTRVVLNLHETITRN